VPDTLPSLKDRAEDRENLLTEVGSRREIDNE
jgi:hypothetical protein